MSYHTLIDHDLETIIVILNNFIVLNVLYVFFSFSNLVTVWFLFQSRFYELENIHGKLDPLVDVDLSPKKTAEVSVEFCEEQTVLTVNLQQSVQELKSFLSDKFGLRPTKMRLFYIDQELKGLDTYGPEEMRFNNRKLYSYQIKDGDEFLVDSK